MNLKISFIKKYRINIYACFINTQVPHEAEYQRAPAKRTSQKMKNGHICYYLDTKTLYSLKIYLLLLARSYDVFVSKKKQYVIPKCPVFELIENTIYIS